MDYFCDLEKLKCVYDLENLFHFLNSIYYKPMRKIEEGNERMHGEWSQGRGTRDSKHASRDK